MKLNKSMMKKQLLGSNEKMGLFPKIFLYALLIAIGFVYLQPVIYMIVNSLMSPEELIDPTVGWVPRSIYLGNYIKAFDTLDFFKSFGNSLLMSIGPAVLQTVSAALVGFGLARFRIKFKPFWFILIVSTFLVPDQIIKIPRYVMYYSYGLVETLWSTYLPATFGQGLKSAIFILIFYQFFASYPKALDEAAQIDGCNKFQIFYRIALPTATPAIILSIVTSIVLYWNETSQSSMFLGEKFATLPVQLGIFADRYSALYGDEKVLNELTRLNESVTLAGTLLSMLPVLILYLFVQRKFIQSVEMTGIAGE